MSFLYPSFLWAFAALSIPVIIHLFNFRRYKTVYFPNVRFLKEVKEKTDSRSQLKHLLILLARLLALSFLVLAFAQPYLREKNTKILSGKRAVSIYIDNSFSMNATSGDLSLLELAKRKAKEIAKAFSPDDQFQLLTNDFEGRHQRLVNRDQLLNLVDEVQQSPDAKNISKVIERQKQALSQTNSPNKLIYIISDFQKTSADISAIQPDSAYRLTAVPLKANLVHNLYIDSCWTQSPVQMLNQPVKLFVRLKNEGDEDLQNSRLTLKLNDEVKSISDFSVTANSSATDTISFNVAKEGWNRGELSITDYPITFDDDYYFAFNVSPNLPVMVIYNGEENPFLKGLFGGGTTFSYHPVSVSQLNYADIKQQQFIVLSGLQDISSGLSEALKTYLQSGGSLLIFPDAKSNTSTYNSFLSAVGADNFVSWNAQPRVVSSINTQEQIFKDVFVSVHENVELPKATGNFVFSSGIRTSAETLMKLNDGSSFINKYSFGKGLFYLCASPLDKSFTDLPVNPLFAPMVFKMAVTKTSSPALAYFIGKNSLVELDNTGVSGQTVFRMKGPKNEFIPAQRNVGNNTVVSFNNQVAEAGFYQLYVPNTDKQSWYGLNFDRKESDLTCLNMDELKSYLQKSNISVLSNSNADLTAAIGEMNLGIVLWKLCLALALVFIAAEILLLRFWK